MKASDSQTCSWCF